MSHSRNFCRSVDRWGVGQNLYIYKQDILSLVILAGLNVGDLFHLLLLQSLRLPPTNWKKAVIDWYDEVGSSLIPIEQMIINRCGCSAEMMSSRLCSTQPSATTASLCGRKHTRYKVVRFSNCKWVGEPD